MTLQRVCDICKNPDKEAKRYNFTYGREIDAAGSLDDVYQEYDLCDFHYIKILNRTLTELSSLYNIHPNHISSLKIEQTEVLKLQRG